MTSWKIRSNSGWRDATFVPVNGAEGQLLRHRITIRGRFWRRPGTDGDLVDDFEVSLQQVLVTQTQLQALLDAMNSWLLDQVGFKCTLGDGDPEIGVEFSVRAGLICSESKPVCTITACFGPAFLGEWAFVVDQSCIRMASEELAAAIRVYWFTGSTSQEMQ
jgi:hypothetical protein